ncbi:predicted protein [Naegleria gruberi]|uniref:Predicted protein n=1 Tax=Naegleria gruberi TaxID=5762 RepID=D2W129_NAEGR|nr:uncharacterized protein NAEGRDRAFT_75068 [Naegleria gruberi]EFC37289.1 predicted protein [Naegleria gruberi]|eukprot:XP_002670033.1 predicted protein [Naegleria gruberi strain NEG-M]
MLKLVKATKFTPCSLATAPRNKSLFVIQLLQSTRLINNNNQIIPILNQYSSISNHANTNNNIIVCRQFHTSHVPREAVIASSKFQMNFSRDLLTYCLILSGFLIWIWWWDPKRDKVYYQVLNSKGLDARTWEDILKSGKSQQGIKLNGKIMLKYQNKPQNSFNVKPLETSARSLDEILLIHYLLTCYNTHRGSREPLYYSTHDFYVIRNVPLALQFIDPKDSRHQVTVDFYLRDALIGPRSEIINGNETLTHLKKERVISGNLLQKFFESVKETVETFNTTREPNGLLWNKEYTDYDQYVQEFVLRNGSVSFIEGQFKTGKSGKLEFHCSLISHEPEQVFMQHLKDEMRWYEKLSLNADNWLTKYLK